MTKAENPVLRRLVKRLRKISKDSGANVWEELARGLGKSNRARAEVNVSQISRHTYEGDTIVVPGKVLGSGRLNHSLSVAAFDFSSRARELILAEGGEVLTIDELLDKNPKGEGIKIIK